MSARPRGRARRPGGPYEQRESVELAFIAALQHLPARQRAVLILRDVLGFSAREAAEALETTPASVDSALQRAHKTVDERLPERSQQATLRSLGDAARCARSSTRYVDAWERGDVDAVVAMLAEDGAIAMPPLPTWYRGRDAVAALPRGRPLAEGRAGASFRPGRTGNWRSATTSGTRSARPSAAQHRRAHAGTASGSREITTFLDPELIPRFGLPDEIEP